MSLAEGFDREFGVWLERARTRILQRLLAAAEHVRPEPYMRELIMGHLSRGGKGLRGTLCMAAAGALGASPEAALPSAAALEMLHNALLVHDDVEDGSEYRRGKPAMHVEYGVPLAINAGDAMQALSLRILRDNFAVLPADRAIRIMDEFDRALLQSLEGQALELGWISDNKCDVSEDDYLRLALKKTCHYSFIHPCRVAAIVARGASYDIDRFDRFGYLLGVAFQIQDDILNLVGDQQRYGKEIAGDLWEGKRTLILAHLFRCISGRDAERLREILAKPRPRKLPREISWILDQLDTHGSIDAATQAARALAEAADQEFERAFADAAPGDEREFVRRLVSYAVMRET